MIANLVAIRTKLRAVIPREAGKIIHSQADMSFETESDQSEYGRYKWKDRKAFGGESNIRYPKLNHTGRLKKSIRTKVVRISASTYSVSVGSNIPYAKVHNEGGYVGAQNVRRRVPKVWRYAKSNISSVPARPFLKVGRKTKEIMRHSIRSTTNTIIKNQL